MNPLSLWDVNENSLEMKIFRPFTVCKDFGSNVCLDKSMPRKMSWRTWNVGNIKG